MVHSGCRAMTKDSTEDFLLQTPLFRISGGTAAERQACSHSIEDAFRLAHLHIAVVKTDEISRYELSVLSQRYDLVLFDGDVDYPLNRIHIGPGAKECDSDLVYTRATDQEMDRFCDQLLEKLAFLALKTPVWACILIGGKSSRMGEPKHLLKGIRSAPEESWIEGTVREITPLVDGLVISGRGDLPATLKGVERIPDIPGFSGPLTGVVSAMRWQPRVSWLVLACDMPFVSGQAVEWLLTERYPGCWGRVPRLAEADFCEPLLAWYDSRARQLFEEQLLTGNMRAGRVASHRKIDNPVIPDEFSLAWKNVNTPEQLQKVQ